jgi:serine/threonine protein kinase
MAAVNGVPPEQLNPYLYFDCEVQAYKHLSVPLEGQIPKTKLVFSITPEQEYELLRSCLNTYQPGKYRRKVGKSVKELPLKAILMEYVEGPRLNKISLLSSQSMKSELLEVVGKMHECGVLWGDVKWRNVVVRGQSGPSDPAKLLSMGENSEERAEHQRALVILDFSNARFRLSNELADTQTDVGSSMLKAEEWEYRRQQELKIVQNMIDHGRLTALPDEVFAK